MADDVIVNLPSVTVQFDGSGGFHRCYRRVVTDVLSLFRAINTFTQNLVGELTVFVVVLK